MSEHGSFYRKITYLTLIAVLLFPISQLGAPSTLEDEGGLLARLREEHDLGQSEIGEIDPASETIRLATLGLRGIAVSLLWNKANEYKKKEDWTNFRATLGQLAKLQPYFISFWRFQAWNLTYNVSVELDDVRDRFHYVKRGIEFLKDGIKYNRDSPYLLSELGWFIGNKIGRADEQKEYRRLFKADDDFHPEDRPPEQRDNWLVSRQWYETALAAVDDRKQSLGQKNPTTFYASPGMSQINYGEAIEKEGIFGDRAKSAWSTAARLWRNYGSRQMKSSRGLLIRLADLNRLEEVSKKLEAELDTLGPDTREQILTERRAALPEQQRALVGISATELTNEQHELLMEATQKLEVTPADIAERIASNDPANAAAARKLANRLEQNRVRTFLTKNNRDVVNYAYWETRCSLEQTTEALRARALAYEANRVFHIDADLLAAKKLFEESFDLWVEVLKQHPQLPDDSATSSDIFEYIEQYNKVLQQLDMSLADEAVAAQFPLWNIIYANDSERKFTEELTIHNRRTGAYPEEESEENNSADSEGSEQDPGTPDQ